MSKHGIGVGVNFRSHVHHRLRSQISEHPFDITRNGEPARPAGIVPQPDDSELDGCVDGNINLEFSANAVFGMFKDAVAETVTGNIRRAPAGQQRRRPEVAALFIPNVKGFAIRIAHGIVRPWSQAELVRIFTPRIGAPAL